MKLDDLHKEALERFKIAEEGWHDIYEEALDDLRFVYDVDGGQWPDEIRKDRKGRPMITVNKLIKFVRQLRNELRINKPHIKVVPVDNVADPKTARLYEALIRQIEYLSSAEIAYDTAYMNAVAASIGFFRITTRYSSPYSFEQDIYINRIMNPFSVHYDPTATDFNFTDAKYCFVDEWIGKKEFKSRYKGADVSSIEGSMTGQVRSLWFKEDKVRVSEYFYKDTKKQKIVLAEKKNPDTGVPMRFTAILDDRIKQEAADGEITVLKERDSEFEVVKWAKISGTEILEDPKDWPGKYIPVIPVIGDEIVVNGKRYLLSLARGAKGPQRMYNYWASAATETVALAPKMPYVVEHRQIHGFEREWEEANIKNRMYIRYKHVPGLDRPRREPQAQVPTAMITMMQTTHFDLEDQLGRYEAAKGAQSNERSGKAILARVAQSDKSTFNFVDNLSRAIVYAGKQLIDLIPKIYDTHRAVRILGEDGSEEVVEVNAPTGKIDPITNKPIIANDLTVGQYDVIATVGPSYTSRRQEAVQMMVQAMQYAPMAAPVLAPLIFKYSDWPGSEEIANELKQYLTAMAQKGGEKK